MASFITLLAYTNFAILLLIAIIISPIQAKRHYPRRNHKPGYGHKNYGSCRVYKPMNGYNMERNLKMSENDASGGEQQSWENEPRGRRVKRIASGSPGQTGAMPWLVFISTTYQFSRDNSTRSQDCTGSLIGPRHVLTNAHCVPVAQMVLSTNLIRVVYGAANKSEGRQILLPKTAAHFHPNYTNFLSQDGTVTMYKNNMVLIDLGKDLDFDETVSSICLVCLKKNIRPYGDAIIAGWGSQNGACNGLPSIYPDVFRYANVGIHPCKTPDYVAMDGVCTFADNSQGIGGGDGGGPVLAAIGKKCHYYQVGVNGRNRCLPSQRENGFEKIDGPWVESVSGIKCMEYAGTEKEICAASLVTKAPIPTTPTNTMETKTPYQCVLPTPTSSTGEQQCQTEEAAMCQLLKDEESLSADAMEGRRTGKRGNALARQYLIDRLRAMAIQPYPTNLDYTQPFNYTYSNGTATISGTIGMNVISFVPGTRLDQVIVISAHYDHLGIFEGQIYNGADDNASGSSALLYLAQFFACPANKPKNSLMFVHFDGEEGNGGPFDALIIRPVPAFPAGSRYFVQNPPLPLDNIKLNINLDMISRNDLGELYVMRSNTKMDKYINGSMGQQNSTPKLLIKESTFNSDHMNFAGANIDYVYFNVGTHADYHKPSDDYVNIQPQFYMNAVKTIQKIIVQLDEALYEGTL